MGIDLDVSTSRERCLVMGICNTTPDSFSDGGLWLDGEKAARHIEAMAADGADIVDIGGESTRPGAARVGVDEELRRVLPAIEAGVNIGVPVSVDTMNAATARHAITAGATYINDVSGGLADPDMSAVVADAGVKYILMHWRGFSDVMDSRDVYDDVVTDVKAELAQRIDDAVAAGVQRENIIIDPGLGFAKTGENNWPLLARMGELRELGYPILIGASRKRFIGNVIHARGATEPSARDHATAAVTALAAAAGAWCVRVHNVAPSADAVRVAATWRAATGGQGKEQS